MKKIFFIVYILSALISGCQKERCYNCPHGVNSYTYVTICSNDWGAQPGGTWQTPANQTYVNYSGCY